MRHLPLIALVLTSCAPDREITVDLSMAFPPDAKAALIATVNLEDGRLEKLIAFELPLNGSFEIVDAGDRVELNLLIYEKSLAELRLGAGEVTLADREPSRPIPAGTSMLQTIVTDGVASSWSPNRTLPPALADAQLTVDCATFSSVSFDLETEAPVHAMLADNSGAVLAFTGGFGQDSQLYRVSWDAVERLDPSVPNWESTLLGLHPFDAAWGSGERIWVGTETGLYVGTPEDGFEAVSPRPEVAGRWFRHMDVVVGAAGEDIVFAQTDYGDVLRYREGQDEWDILNFDMSRELIRCGSSPNAICGNVIASSENTYFFLPSGEGAVMRWAGGEFRQEVVPSPSLGLITTTAVTPLGLLAVRSNADSAHAFRRREGAWESAETFVTQRVTAIVGFDDAVFLTGVYAFITEWTADAVCETVGGGTGMFEPGDAVRSGSNIFIARGDNIFPPSRSAVTKVVAIRPQWAFR